MPKKTPLRGADASAGLVNDSRFSSMHNAPIFKKIKKDNNKITVDERFQTVLTDDRFRAVPGTIDIYGRKSKKSTKAAAEKELNSFYQIEDNSILDDGAAELSKSTSTTTSSKNVVANRNLSKVEGLKHEDPETRLEYLNRLARGDVSGSSSDESDDLAEDSDADTDDSDSEGAAADDRSGSKQAGPLDIYSDEDEEGDGEEAHATCRLALMNCDWDNLKALDLLSVLQSFCPTGKTVKSVVVYPSDFGKEKMANEATHGPPKIWIGGNDDSDFEEADDEIEDGEDEDEDEGYDGIEAIDQEDIPVPAKKGDKWKRNMSKVTATTTEQAKSKISKSDRKGDFKRLPGTVGIVLQDDLVIRGKSRDDDVGDDEDDSEGEEGAKYFDGDLSTTKITGKSDIKGKKSQPRNLDRMKTMERERFTGAGKGNEDGEGGFDEVALRAYELSKLKYYFAVATLSCIESAEALMAQLDGVELGHSSMVFDLRYIPEDTSFEGRDVRDQSFEIGMDYQPPDFVVNALQHTTVQCSWDEGEKDRERKLTNISQWRQLQESELLQYVASSDSDDEGEDSDDDNDSSKKVSASKGSTKQSAANLRRLLLGVGSDDEFSEDSDDERHSAAPKRSTDEAPLGGEGFNDDFFMDDGDKEQVNGKATKAAATKKKSGKGTKDESDMTYTYVPDSKILQGRAEERDVDETPFESMQRKLAEKRKSRKAAKKLVKSALSADDGEVVSEKQSKKATKIVKEQVAATKAELELLLSDDDEGYDMRALHKEEQDLLKGSKGKRKSRSKKPKEPEDAALLKDSTSASGGDFTLDLQDSRFARLLEGDSSFGIDRTSADFKETKAMKQIFGEQRSRREKGETLGNRSDRKVPDVVKDDLADNVGDLVSKLKRKYALQEPSKSKQARL